MQKIQKVLSMAMVLAVLGSSLLRPSVHTDAADALTPYREELAELNQKLRTSYSFPSEEQLAEYGESYADLLEFCRSMTIAEFREYVMDAYQRAIASEDQSSAENRMLAAGNRARVIEDVADPCSYKSTQRYYYTIVNYNNLYIKATCYTGDGERYSSVNGYGESHTAYPYLDPFSIDVSYNTGRTKVRCTFHCNRYLAKYIMDDGFEGITVRFTAGGGNLYKA